MKLVLTHHMADVLNRIGLVLGFASFWFAAPEFIGEDRLRMWETTLASGLLKVPLLLQIAISLITLALIGFAIFGGHETGHILHEPPFILVIVLDILFVMQSFIERRLNRIVHWLANDSRRRQRALLIGAALFTMSSLLQFVATYSPPQ
jgi:hypothetical protein